MSRYNDFLKYAKENHDELTAQLALSAIQATHNYLSSAAESLTEIAFELENLKKLLTQSGLPDHFILNITRALEIRLIQLEYALEKFGIDNHNETTRKIVTKFQDLNNEYQRIAHLAKVCVIAPDTHNPFNMREQLEREVWLLNKEMEALIREQQGQINRQQARADILQQTSVSEHYDITPAQIKEECDALISTLEAKAAKLSTKEFISERNHLLKKAALLKKNYAIFMGVLEAKQNTAGKRFPQESISLFTQVATDLAKETDNIIHHTLDYNLTKEAFDALQLRENQQPSAHTTRSTSNHSRQHAEPLHREATHTRQRVHPAAQEHAVRHQTHTAKTTTHKAHTSHLARDEELFRKEMAALQREQKESGSKHKSSDIHFPPEGKK